MDQVINNEEITWEDELLHHDEGVDLIPANIALSGMETVLYNAMSRETVLRRALIPSCLQYDYTLIDCMPSLGMLPINALTAADSLIIPMQAQFLPQKGLEQLIKTIRLVRQQLNPVLEIEGILMTMVNKRTNNAKEISRNIRETYGEYFNVFDVEIPHSVRAIEASAEGKSIFEYDPKGQVAEAYEMLVRELMNNEQ